MSEGHSEEHPAASDVPLEAEENPPPQEAPPRRRSAAVLVALSFFGALAVIAAVVALSPFWAPEILPLLPWSTNSAASNEEYDVLAARVGALEKRAPPQSADLGPLKSAIETLGRRVEQIETTVNSRLSEIEKRPATAGADADAVKSAQAALGQRIDQLDQRVAQLDRRFAEAELQASARTTSEIADVQKNKDELTRLNTVAADIAKRLPELEQQIQSQRGAEQADASLAVLLLRIQDAVQQGRPFPAEYAALKRLSRDPDLVREAEPLADAAQKGVATRAVLNSRLAELAGEVATAPEPPPASDWGAQALARLRGLVTIRRIDGPAQSGPEAAVSAAQRALARGDLTDAVAAMERLGGANAEAAGPWLRMARERLAVEGALDRLQHSLEARLGGASAAPGATPPAPSAKEKAPS